MPEPSTTSYAISGLANDHGPHDSGISSVTSSRPSSGHGKPYPAVQTTERHTPQKIEGSQPAMIGDDRKGRSVGMQSLLNPMGDSSEPRGRIRKADELEPPSPRHSGPLPPPGGFADYKRHPEGADAPGAGSRYPLGSDATASAGRRILEARSPVRRIASLNTVRTGTLNVSENPFLPSGTRSLMAETAVQHAPSATPPLTRRPSYGFAAAPTPPLTSNHRPGFSVPAPIAQIQSGSASPSSSLASSQQSPVPQAAPFVPTVQGSYYPPAAGVGPPSAGPHEGERPSYGIPMSGSGQSNYQLMAIKTDYGPVHFPVDVQAASRAADDKRRRNAGASARFRQRRKEKEREASSTISRMEQELKEARDDIDFYRRERDYLAGALLQTPDGQRHFPRPRSPRPGRSRSGSDDQSRYGGVSTDQSSQTSSDAGHSHQQQASTQQQQQHHRSSGMNSVAQQPGSPSAAYHGNHYPNGLQRAPTPSYSSMSANSHLPPLQTNGQSAERPSPIHRIASYEGYKG